jgi:hypothetical protein
MVIVIEVKEGKTTVKIDPPEKKRESFTDIFIDTFNLRQHIHPYYRYDE